jgi:hypothetical protein
MFDPPPANALNPDRLEATKFSEKKSPGRIAAPGLNSFRCTIIAKSGEGDDRPEELFRFRLSGWLLARLPLCLWLRLNTAGREPKREHQEPAELQAKW